MAKAKKQIINDSGASVPGGKDRSVVIRALGKETPSSLKREEVEPKSKLGVVSSVLPDSTAKDEKTPIVKKAKKARKEHFWLKISPFFIIIILLGVVVFLNYGLYRTESLRTVAEPVAKTLHYPVIIVGTSVVSYTEFADELARYRQFNAVESSPVVYSSANMASAEELVLTKLVQDHLLAKGLNTYGVAMTDQELEKAFFNLFASSSDSPDADQLTSEVFNASAVDVKEYLLRPFLIKRKLSSVLLSEANLLQQQAIVAQTIKTDLENNPELFDSYISGSATPQGAVAEDIGYYSTANLPEGFQSLNVLEENQISDVIESSQGYHVIRIKEIISSDANQGARYLHLEQVFVKKPDADTWLASEARDTSIISISPMYTWDKVCLRIVRKGNECGATQKQSGYQIDFTEEDLLESIISGSQDVIPFSPPGL